VLVGAKAVRSVVGPGIGSQHCREDVSEIELELAAATGSIDCAES
jgi:hypothetical protein